MVKIDISGSKKFLIFVVKNEDKLLSNRLTGNLRSHMTHLSNQTCKHIKAHRNNCELPIQDCNFIMMGLIDFILHFFDNIISKTVTSKKDVSIVKHDAKIALKASHALDKMIDVIKANGYHDKQLKSFETKNKVFNKIIHDLTKSL